MRFADPGDSWQVLIAKRISAAGRRGSSRPLIVEPHAGVRIVKLFLRGLAEEDAQRIDRRRAAYASFLWKRLKPPRPFLETRPLPPARPDRKCPAWLIGR